MADLLFNFELPSPGQCVLNQDKELPDRAYAPWNEAEDDYLIAQIRAGRTSKELAAILKRRQGSIVARRNKLLPDEKEMGKKMPSLNIMADLLSDFDMPKAERLLSNRATGLPDRAYAPWNEAEDDYLIGQIEVGKTSKKLACILLRQTKAVTARRKRLEKEMGKKIPTPKKVGIKKFVKKRSVYGASKRIENIVDLKNLHYFRLYQGVYDLGNYFPTYNQNHHECSYSKNILALKSHQPQAIEYFTKLLKKVLPNSLSLCAVPGHDPGNPDTGLIKCLKEILRESAFDSEISNLYRKYRVPKSAYGLKDKEKTLKSVGLRVPDNVKNKNIILVDDVVTTGNTMSSCRDILKNAGARKVFCMALSRTYCGLKTDLQIEEVAQYRLVMVKKLLTALKGIPRDTNLGSLAHKLKVDSVGLHRLIKCDFYDEREIDMIKSLDEMSQTYRELICAV